VELLGRKQVGFDLGPAAALPVAAVAEAARPGGPRVSKFWLTDAVRERKEAFVRALKTPIWADYISERRRSEPEGL
jgi:DNA polymerase III subunit epsilon